MSRFKKLIGHIKKGTVTDRIKYQFSGLKKWEDMKAGKRKFVIHSLTPDTKIKLYPDSYLSFLILRGDFESQELDFVSKVLRPSDIFIDIGANIGIFSLLANERNCKVYSIEPTPKTFERLQENLSLNKFSDSNSYHLAFSNSDGVTFLNVSENGLDAWNNISERSEEGFVKVEIKTRKFDSFIKDLPIKKNDFIFVKMDVEGWELKVLNGAEHFLSDYSPVWMIEFNDENFSKNQYKGKELVHFLNGKGYLFYEMKGNDLVPHTTLEDYGYMNLIAAKNIAQLQARLKK